MGEAAAPIEGVVYEEAGRHQPLLVVLGCIYREKKKELRQGITSFTKLPACFGSNETFILVCADGALSQHGVQRVAKKYMMLIGETWKGRDEQQQRFWEDDRRVQQTWFGAVKCGFLWAHETGTPLPIMLLLKNTESCIRQRKIWSHVLAFLLLRKADQLNDSFALMIDGDTSFDAHHVSSLYTDLLTRPDLCALSARIAPSSRGNMLLVASQKVEYALAHYLDKVAESYLGGSALCAPGCFTLVRLEALVKKCKAAKKEKRRQRKKERQERREVAKRQREQQRANGAQADAEGGNGDNNHPNGDDEEKRRKEEEKARKEREKDQKWQSKKEDTVLHRYGRLPRSMLGALKSLQGEDRFLSTLLITADWKIACRNDVVVTTACPAGWRAYVTQRRRWLPSTLANQFALITEYSQSELFGWRKWLIVPHIVLQLAGALLAMPLVAMLYSNACAVALGALGYVIALFPPVLFALFCWIFWCDPADSTKRRNRNSEIQLTCFQWLSTFYIAISVLILGLLLWQVAASSVLNVWTPESIFFGTLVVLYLVALLLHFDLGNALRLPALFLLVPVMYMLQPIYIIANMHDYRWGTRENNAHAPADGEDETSFWGLFKHGFKRVLCMSRHRPHVAPPVLPVAAPVAAQAVPQVQALGQQPQESPADGRGRRNESPGVGPALSEPGVTRQCDWLVTHACAPSNDVKDTWRDVMRRLERPSEELYNAEADRLTQSLLLAQASIVRWIVCVSLATVLFIVSFAAIGHTGPREKQTTDGIWTRIPTHAGPVTLDPAHIPSYLLMAMWLVSLLVTSLCMLCERFFAGLRCGANILLCGCRK